MVEGRCFENGRGSRNVSLTQNELGRKFCCYQFHLLNKGSNSLAVQSNSPGYCNSGKVTFNFSVAYLVSIHAQHQHVCLSSTLKDTKSCERKQYPCKALFAWEEERHEQQRKPQLHVIGTMCIIPSISQLGEKQGMMT